jgi:hypothetical protein
MNGSRETQSNLVDTTDCLEAVGVCRGWKTFLFVIMVLCLILLQISFWLVDTGYIKTKSVGSAFADAVSVSRGRSVASSSAEEPFVSMEYGGTGQSDAIKVAAERVVAEDLASGNEEAPQSQQRRFFFIIKIRHLNLAIRLCNFILILAAMLYCLTMLFCFKVSLIGRLGGINHICRAFFISLFVVILLLPWQNFFGNVVVGAIYTTDELIKSSAVKNRDIFGTVVHYLRFSGYWLLVMLLLVFSQIRSFRWTKNVLRRLEIL